MLLPALLTLAALFVYPLLGILFRSVYKAGYTLDVTADQRRVVQAARRRGRPLADGTEVGVADPGPLGFEGVEFAAVGGGRHGRILLPYGAPVTLTVGWRGEFTNREAW